MTDASQELQKIRHDWYQTDSQIVLNILCKNVKSEEFSIKYEPELIVVVIIDNNGEKRHLNFNLLYQVKPDECFYKILPSKIEIKLKKVESIWWRTLVKDNSIGDHTKQAMSKIYPSSSVKPKDWDKVVGEMTNKDDDGLEGDAALNALFQKIYSDGSDEVRKAMNKSFVESAGTVLSTNWKEIEREKVSVKPPDGMEFKKWD